MDGETLGEEAVPTDETTSSTLFDSSESSLCQIPFPLPPHTDHSLCRDKFLKNILKDYDPFVRQRREPRFIEQTWRANTSLTAQGLAIQRMVERKSRKTILAIQMPRPSPHTTVQNEQEIFRTYIRQFQRDAIEFLVARILGQLELFENVWPGDINEIPHKLFWWSVEHFLRRLSINQLYLDVITMERGQDALDCMKYRTDLKEISRILNAIRDDFCGEQDLCKGGIAMMHAANYHINSNWINEIQEIVIEHEDLVRKIFEFRATSIIKGHTQARQSALMIERDTQDAITPIELRYRIKWVRSGVEHFMLKIQQKVEALERELSNTVSRMSHNALAFHYTETLYGLQIHKYQNQIADWQQRYDNEFDNVDLQCTQTRLAVDKTKEEHKFYSDQLNTMKRRIAEVTEQIKNEEQQRLQEAMVEEQREMEKIKALEDKQRKKELRDKKKRKSGKKSITKF